jgi:gamma-glutamyltranspeptidase / glutathione hydrolase
MSDCADEICQLNVAAGMNITEPCSTGIGGDMFLLYWDAASKTVKAMNGSGRAPGNISLEQVRKELKLDSGISSVGDNIPSSNAHSVTVPGAPAGWVDTVERFGSGKLSMEEILAPAIRLGEEGFPVSEITAYSVSASELLLRSRSSTT